MFVNREKRITYLGFNDFWFTVVGIIFLSFITDYLFNRSFLRFPFGEAIVYWSISLFFTICNWLIIRNVIILLRKQFTHFKDVGKRLILLFLAIVATVILVDFTGNKILSLIFNRDYGSQSFYRVRLPVIIISTMTMAIYEAIYYYIRLKKTIIEEEQAKQAIVQAELDALKNQAQPHFLFNTLNTLRDIIEQNSKEDAVEFVDKLSNVYRFILESGNANLISLAQELKFAKSYIHIQRERFGKNLKMEWSIPDTNLDNMIVPMSLQLLLENAIKHNVISKAKPLTIYVEVEDSRLIVTNKIQPKSTKIPSTKVGLKNIEKRYHLISGKSIKIKNDDNHFSISIPLLRSSVLKNYDERTYN